MDLVFRLVFKTSSGRITPSVAGSIPALSANDLRIPWISRILIS